MLKIYDVMIQVMVEMKPVVGNVQRHDPDLARQLKRAASSVALNIAEGSGSSGGTRTQRYRNALGSAREVGACFDIAHALGYCAIDRGLRDGLRQVQATLLKVAL